MKIGDSKLFGCLIAFILFGAAMEFSYASSSYYVSPMGNERNDGTSPSLPWQTPNIVNSRRFNPGDKILFERGGEWYGQLNVPGSGRLSVDIRMVIGALIIKHKLSLSDQDTVDMISENVSMQYFCGLKSFQSEPPFDASLFVDIRKRMESDKFDEFNKTVIRRAESLKPKRNKSRKELRLLLAINCDLSNGTFHQ